MTVTVIHFIPLILLHNRRSQSSIEALQAFRFDSNLIFEALVTFKGCPTSKRILEKADNSRKRPVKRMAKKSSLPKASLHDLYIPIRALKLGSTQLARVHGEVMLRYVCSLRFNLGKKRK
jgi:hypothetical protein